MNSYTLSLLGIICCQIMFMKAASQINFCGETLPLTEEHTRANFESVLTRIIKKANPNGLYIRAQKYFPYVQEMLSRYNIPDDFKYLAIVETGYRNYLPNRAGAGGMWSITLATAKTLGLKVENGIDERLDVEKATNAALKFIRSLYRQFGSWTLAAAAYNGGPAVIKKKASQQTEPNYYHMPLCKETREYVLKIIAIKELFENQLNTNLVWQRISHFGLAGKFDNHVESSLGGFSNDSAEKARSFGRFNTVSFRHAEKELTAKIIGGQQGRVTMKIEDDYVTGSVLFTRGVWLVQINYAGQTWESNPFERIEPGLVLQLKTL